MSFQTRNREGTLKYFKTFAEAFQESKRDMTVWKISFDHEGTDYRWRPKTRHDFWSQASELKLCSMLSTYDAEPANSRTVYWVHQVVLAPNFRKICDEWAEDPVRQEEELALDSILEILTEAEFQRRFT